MIKAPSILIAAAALAAVAAGCSSTQDKAAEAQAAGDALRATQVPLAIPKENPEVKVLGTTLLSDQNGAAVVVELENTSKQTMVGVPILVDVKDAKGRSVFRNDAFGLDFALNHAPILEPGERTYWVNDQVLATGDVKDAKVKVGMPELASAPKLPEVVVGAPRIHDDPSGVEVEGSVDNKSDIDQTKLVFFAVAQSGGEIVAAGRGLLKKLKAGSSGRFNIFFIGDPQGADVSVTAPPSVTG